MACLCSVWSVYNNDIHEVFTPYTHAHIYMPHINMPCYIHITHAHVYSYINIKAYAIKKPVKACKNIF